MPAPTVQPTLVVLVEAAGAGERGLDVAEGGAAGEVGQEAVEGVADAAARRAEPVVAWSRRCRRQLVVTSP